MNNKIVIAIDGPAGSGKSTTAKAVAEQLGYIYIDTGAMYRAITLAVLRLYSGEKSGIVEAEEIEEAHLAGVLEGVDIRLEASQGGQRTFLDGEDVSEEIRTREVTAAVSRVSSFASVREKLTAMQREYGKGGGVVMDGRDIGTNVFPGAELKIFMVASSRVRAERRLKELHAKGIAISLEELEQDIIERDRKDSTRAISPLVKAADAVEINTTECTPAEQIEKIVQLVQQRTQ